MSLFRFAAAAILLLTCPIQSRSQDSKENADFKLAINLYNDGMYDLAGEQLKQFIATYPSSSQGIDARFYLGLTQLKLSKFDDARLTFQTFALTYPDNPKAPEAWWNVGESYASVRNYREAALAFERVRVFHPKSKSAPDALLRAGGYFALAGERDNARRVLRTILQDYPTSAAVTAARIRLGRMYYEDGNLEQAQSELKRAVEGEPSADARAQALLLLGNIYQSMGRTDQAETNYQEVLTKYKSSTAAAAANLSMGRLRASEGKYAEAVESFRNVVGAAADTALRLDAMIAIGDAYGALNDVENAIASYRKFLTVAPGDERSPGVLWSLASVAASGKEYRTSDEACSRLLTMNAADQLRERALMRTALNAEEQHNPLLAVQLEGTFADRYRDDPATPAVLLRASRLCERELHDPLKASGTYELIATRYPDSPLAVEAIDGAARCHEEMKEYDAALRLSREFIDKYPASELRTKVEERIWRIETFEARDKDAGLEKLALLVGDVMNAKDKAGLAFRLGDIYFHDLKNYQAAAAQFTSAIESGLQDARLADALFMRARSLEILSWNDPTERPKAIDAYRIYLHSFPDGPQSNDAELSVFVLSATRVDSANAAYLDLLTRRPNFARRDTMMLTLGLLQESNHDTPAALTTFRNIVRSFPASAAAEVAGERLVSLRLAEGTTDSALAAGASYVSRYPRGRFTALLLDRLADSCMSAGQPNRAADFYRQLATGFPYTSAARDAKRREADALLADKDYAGAIALYREMIDVQRSDPMSDGSADPSLLLALGRAYQLDGKTDEAKKNLFEVVSRVHQGPIAAQAFTTLGVMYRADGALDIATGYFRQAESASPGTADSRDIAELFFESGNYGDAIRLFTQLSHTATSERERMHDDARIIVARIRSEGPAKLGPEVSAFAKKYRDVDEELASFQLEQGNYYYGQRDYARALKAFEVVSSKFDGSTSAPVAQYWIARTLEATDKPLEAVKRLNDLIKDHPTAEVIPRAYLALGNLSYNAEKWDEAIRNYKRIVDDPKADPELLPMAMTNLVETYESAGIFDAALNLTRKYLEQFPNAEDSFDMKIKIGILYDRLGYYDQSVLQLQSLLDEAGSDLEGELRYYIAQANFDKGDYQQAILDFLKVPYLVTKKGKIDWTANSFYMAGQAYEKMGRFDQALTMYRQIVDRQGIDATFKAAAKKEIDRVTLVLKKKPG